MKKIILLLLAVLSTSLFSQSPKYWEKIDFQFDSGIKFIHFDMEPYSYYPDYDKFFVVTDSNSFCLFDSIKAVPKIIKVKIPDCTIKDAQILIYHDTTFIYLITEDKRLFLSDDLGVHWNQIISEIDSCYVNCMLISDSYNGINTPIIIGTENNGIYIKSSIAKWENLSEGLDNKNVLFIKNSWKFGTHYCMTNDGKIYDDVNSKWEPYQTFDINKTFKDIGELFHSYLLLNDDYELYNDQQKIVLSDSIKITCFSSYMAWALTIISNDQIPYRYPLIIGTKQNGIYFYDQFDSFTQLSNELFGKDITDIELNNLNNPNLCLVGTKDGELYYGNIEKPPTDVNEHVHNALLSTISPQPASTKAKLSFTLPENLRVSVKLFNASGMGMLDLADGIFIQGENSVPIDVSGLADGIYFVGIEYNGGRVIEKMVVRR
jgi:hypothetical protein